MKNKKQIFNALFLILGFLALAFMIYKIGIDTIFDGLKAVGWWFLVVMLVWLAVYVLNTLSWNIIIRDGEKNNKPSFFYLTQVTISGFVINYITPFMAVGGEPYKIFKLKNIMGTNKATSVVILYSMMHIFTHMIFWLFSIILAYFYLKPALVPSLLLLLAFVCFVIIILFFYKGYKNGFVVELFRFFAKIPFLNKWVHKFVEKNRENLQEIDEQISILHNHRKTSFYLSFFVEFISRILGCFELTVIMFALSPMFPDVNFTIADAIIITAGYQFFANALFFTPMQIGSREGGYLLAYEAVSLPSAPAMIVSIITRIRELFWIVIGVILIKLTPGYKAENYKE